MPTQTPSWSERKVYAADGNAQAWLGSAVAVSGDFALVGAKNTTVDGSEHQGAVYVYQKLGGVWKQVQKLTAADGVAGDQFGTSVALFGSLAIVTAPYATVNGRTWQGAAYAFIISPQGCKQTQKIVARNGAAFETFGMLVQMDSKWVFISSGGANRGGSIIPFRVRAFKPQPRGIAGTWTEHSVLNSPDAEDLSNGFGASVAVAGSRLLIGSRTVTLNGRAGQGAAYIYTYDSSERWTLDTRLTAQDGAARDNFGVSVALSDQEVFVGAFGATIDGNVSQGAVYRFANVGGKWAQTQKILAEEGAAASLFGSSMSFSQNKLLVGAYAVDDYRGAAYVFAPSGGLWKQIKTLTASDGAIRDVFGYYCALSKSDALVGAYGASIETSRQGAAYFFAMPQRAVVSSS